MNRLGLERFTEVFDDEGYDTLKLVSQMCVGACVR